MSSSESRKTLKNYLRSVTSKEEAFEAYVSQIEKSINPSSETNSTHVITWSNGNELKKYLAKGLMGHWSKLIKMPAIIEKRSFSYKTYHSFKADQLKRLEMAEEKRLQAEDFSKLLIGIFGWLILLSLTTYLIVGSLSIYLAIFGIVVVVWSLHRFSTAKYRYLPEDLRKISADYWAIKSISETNFNEKI